MSLSTPTKHSDSLTLYQSLHAQLSEIIKGQETTLHYILACYFTGHHVLLEDFPGTGKTTLAKELARHLENTESKRVQFTPDLLPSDLTGVNIFDPSKRAFTFQRGPLFCDILLADEINRASPRTQSALLEAMAEHQVSIEGTTYKLPENFFVIATQNPIEFKGTYQLPEAQLDRFGIQCSLGYLDHENERELLESKLTDNNDLRNLPVTLSLDALCAIHDVIPNIHLSDNLKDYIISLVASTRTDPDIYLPLSPRATVTLAKLAQAYSFCLGKEFVTASVIQELAPLVLAHRLILTNPSLNTTQGKLNHVAELLGKINV